MATSDVCSVRRRAGTSAISAPVDAPVCLEASKAFVFTKPEFPISLFDFNAQADNLSEY